MEKRGLFQPVYRIILYPGMNIARKNGVKFGGEKKGFFKGKPPESAFKTHPRGLGGDFERELLPIHVIVL